MVPIKWNAESLSTQIAKESLSSLVSQCECSVHQTGGWNRTAFSLLQPHFGESCCVRELCEWLAPTDSSAADVGCANLPIPLIGKWAGCRPTGKGEAKGILEGETNQCQCDGRREDEEQ